MRPWQNLLALAGTLSAAAGLLPVQTGIRLSCVALACGAGALLLGLRLRAHGMRPDSTPDDVYERIARIRAARGRRRP